MGGLQPALDAEVEDNAPHVSIQTHRIFLEFLILCSYQQFDSCLDGVRVES